MKKKGLILIIIFLLLSLIGIAIYIFNIPKVNIIKDKFIFEYGEKPVLKNNEIIKTSNEKVIKSINIDLSTITNEEEKDYPSVGIYEINVTYTIRNKKATKNVSVEIKDTTAPEFTKFKDSFEIEQGTKKDYKKDYAANDLSKVEILIDDSNVDNTKIGTYSLLITAIDEYENKTEKEAKVKIIAKKNNDIYTCNKNIKEPTFVNGILIVNKKNPLPCGYGNGEDKTAKAAIDKLIKAMQKEGLNVSNSYSGYRSFNTQADLYSRYVKEDGQKNADTYSARPGHSEHQTGLAFDLRYKSGTLIDKGKEAKWIAENAHKYGFIVRYQQGKEKITGYMAEPWHLRYIGSEAEDIYNSGLTLEEYLEVLGGDYY